MKPMVFLRIASIVALLETLGHSFLFVSYVPAHGPEEMALVATMKLHRFSFGGFTHSYWDLYFGYGLFVSITCFVQAVLLWQLAILAKNSPLRIRSLVAPLVLGEAGYALLMWKYFFLVPIVSHTFMALCLGLAFLTAAPSSPAQQSAPEHAR